MPNLAPFVYKVRGECVLLDVDLCLHYGIPLSTLRRVVKRNPRRFPDDFVPHLSAKELGEIALRRPISESLAPPDTDTLAFTLGGRAAQANVEIMRAIRRIADLRDVDGAEAMPGIQ